MTQKILNSSFLKAESDNEAGQHTPEMIRIKNNLFNIFKLANIVLLIMS